MKLKLSNNSKGVSSGLKLWRSKVAIIRGILESFIKDELIKRGYKPVYTPHIGRLELYRTSGHFPYYRDAQYPPMYHHPAGSALDLAQHRLAAGLLDEKREQEMAQFMELTQFYVPDYAEARTPEARLEAVHRYVLTVLKATGVDVPSYQKATTWADRAQALLTWLAEQEGYLLKPMNCPHHIQIYKAEPSSYRDLPVRLAAFGP